jgi:Uma2 family endonuclease
MASSSSGSEGRGYVYVADEQRRRERRQTMTVQEYFRTPETVLPQELIYGAIRVADSPSPVHQHVVGQLYVALREHLRSRRLGIVWLAPLDVVLDADRALVVQPDLFVILDGGAAIVGDKVFGPPDLTIEVLSPRARIGDTEQRLAWFAQYGVRECWLVNQPEQRIEVVRFENAEIASRGGFGASDPIMSLVLPEFSASLAAILGSAP